MPATLAHAAADPEFQALALTRHAGDPSALTTLALRLFLGRDAPLSPADGLALLEAAAKQDDAAAWHHLATLNAAGAAAGASMEVAWAALCRAAARGHGGAGTQLALLDAAGIRSAADAESWLTPPPVRAICGEPRIAACAGFIPPAWCDHLRTMAANRLERAQVYDAQHLRLRPDPMRTSRNAAFAVIDTDVVTQLIRGRIARLAGVERSGLEPPEVLHYSVGEQYRLHVDFFHPSVPHFSELVAQSGQRIRTCLVYLNDDYEGGATEFPRLDLRFRGSPGEALVFHNTGADGAGDMRTAHAGMPVTQGGKWLFSQWIRDRPQPFA